MEGRASKLRPKPQVAKQWEEIEPPMESWSARALRYALGRPALDLVSGHQALTNLPGELRAREKHPSLVVGAYEGNAGW